MNRIYIQHKNQNKKGVTIMLEKIKKTGGHVKEYLSNEEAIGVVEIILILVVLIALVLLFKDQIVKVVNDAFKSFNDDSSQIIG